MSYFCKNSVNGCEALSMSEPFEQDICDCCWERESGEEYEYHEAEEGVPCSKCVREPIVERECHCLLEGKHNVSYHG